MTKWLHVTSSLPTSLRVPFVPKQNTQGYNPCVFLNSYIKSVQASWTCKSINYIWLKVCPTMCWPKWISMCWIVSKPSDETFNHLVNDLWGKFLIALVGLTACPRWPIQTLPRTVIHMSCLRVKITSLVNPNLTIIHQQSNFEILFTL